jgi:hypothetical protein
LPVEVPVYVAQAVVPPSTDKRTTMTTISSWTLSVLGVLALVLALHHLGVDVTANLGAALRGTEHFLGQPLLSL